MSNTFFLLRKLRSDRTFFYRLFSLVLFVSAEIFTVLVLNFHENGQLRHIAVMNAVTGVTIASIFVYGAVDLSKRNVNYETVKTEKDVITSKFTTTQDLLFRIDNETRQEVGSWLHGTLQPQLTRLARDIRAKKETDCDIVAQRVDEINEKYVRAYSHDLYPPSLIVSLEVGLETLLDGRAELTLDHQLTNASNIGFSIWSSESGFEDSTRPLRLVLGRERGYATYRIIEEAVANAEKKSSASQIAVDVRVEGEQIRILVHDNGAPISKDAKRGLGHSVIDTSVQKFDGNWSFTNVADGVELIALIPYTPLTVAATLNRRFQGGLDE
jgi:signal transduction histidine kinase